MLKCQDTFDNLGLNSGIIDILKKIGYETPLPIQAQCIPFLLAGHDVLGMAHTGSGKTIAFLLPLFQNINIRYDFVQGLVITPTRELAIQIGQVCKNFTKYMNKTNVTVLYGGQNYNIQLQSLKKKPYIIIGTPGRLLDYLNRGIIDISKLKTLIIDEADEMLRMGFIADMEKIIKKTPLSRQTALFSATLPTDICKISRRFMRNPKSIYINSHTNSICSNIRQSYWLVNGIDKNDALVRFLEVEDFEAAVVFVRTKCITLKVSKILDKFGFNSAALNGDMCQIDRDQTISRLRNGKLDVLVTTDVASRGLDIHRISLVINYDAPDNYNSYVHRIGRTGRAGQFGKSLLFVERQEYYLLRKIKFKEVNNIFETQYPTSSSIINHRLIRLSSRINRQLNDQDIEIYKSLLARLKLNRNLNMECLAAILLKMVQENRPLVLPVDPVEKRKISIIKNARRIKTCYQKQSVLEKVNRKSDIYPKKLKFDINNIINLYRISIGCNDGVNVRYISEAISDKLGKYYNIRHIQLFSFYSIVEISRMKSISHKILPKLFHVSILDKLVKIKFLRCITDRKISVNNK